MVFIQNSNGDSGSPLIKERENEDESLWYLIGITSYGPALCGTTSYPGIYTNVIHYIEWIKAKIKLWDFIGNNSNLRGSPWASSKKKSIQFIRSTAKIHIKSSFSWSNSSHRFLIPTRHWSRSHAFVIFLREPAQYSKTCSEWRSQNICCDRKSPKYYWLILFIFTSALLRRVSLIKQKILTLCWFHRFLEKCSSPDQYPGTCVELEQCQSVSKLRFKSPISHLDRLYVSLSQCGFSNGKPMVCCTKSPFPMKLLGETETQLAPEPQTTTTTTMRPWLSTTLFQVASTTQESIRTTSQVIQEKPECSGIIDNRIFGGSNTRINEMPFTALLSYSRCEFLFQRLVTKSWIFSS